MSLKNHSESQGKIKNSSVSSPKFSLKYLTLLHSGIQLTQLLVLQMIPYVSAILFEAKSVE